ncbi:MAG TPA: type II secretion system F family protein, partial [Candidatus Omnitrophota bacterium]|nr:type II secretion system F family protein [Candidatus Omnitrophota bacterium]
MLFTYQAVTAQGEKVKGTIEAVDRKDAGVKLNEKGLQPVAIQESVLPHSRLFSPLFGKVRSDELLIFYSQLYDMVSAGINFLKSLEMISEQTRNRKLKNAIDDIIALLRKGTSISDAFDQHKDIFPPLFVSMIKSGEASGELETVLRNYNVLYDEHLEIQRKIAGALFYPVVLFCLGMAVILFLVVFIVPKFVEIFSTAGIALPMITQVLYVFGTSVIRYWYLILAVTGLVAWGIWRYLKTGPGRYHVDSLKLMIPVFGPLNRNVAFSRFLTTMGLLLKSGVSIIKALELASDVMQNVVLQSSMAEFPERMRRGETLSAM